MEREIAQWVHPMKDRSDDPPYHERTPARGRVSAHVGMSRRIDPLWWTHCAISRSSQCTTTELTKVVVYAILSVGWYI